MKLKVAKQTVQKLQNFINLTEIYVANSLKLRKSGILEVDKMSGRKFEEYLQTLLKANATMYN